MTTEPIADRHVIIKAAQTRIDAALLDAAAALEASRSHHSDPGA